MPLRIGIDRPVMSNVGVNLMRTSFHGHGCHVFAFLTILAGSVLAFHMPTAGQVVIDMPPPRKAAEKSDESRAAESRGEQISNECDEADVDSAVVDDADDEAGEQQESAQWAVTDRSPTATGEQAQQYDELGRLALARYTGGRQYARPNDPYLHWGYQPRGRGVGPWGLGHHSAWYGDPYVVAPLIIFQTRRHGFFWPKRHFIKK
jgi:hypothetical protein